MAELVLTSPEFEMNQMIPRRYTCQGEDINPPLQIANIPPGTKSLVLIVEDPDAPQQTWDHWVVWNIPPISEIEEGHTPEKAVTGVNSWGKQSYGGPCPPSGTHRYFFTLYALNSTLSLPPDSRKKDLEKAISSSRLLGKSTLIGLYRKS